MTKEKAKELSDILKAYSEGKTIQICCGNQSWKDVSDVEMDRFIGYSQPRVKPQPKLVPFTFEDNKLFRDKYVRIKGCIALSKITSFGKDGIYFKRNDDQVSSYQYLLNNCEFEDGSPCGKYINE